MSWGGGGGKKGRKKIQQVKWSQILSPQGRSRAAVEEWSLLCGGREGGLGGVKQRKRVEIQVEGMLAARRRLQFCCLMNSDKPRSILPPPLIQPETLAPRREEGGLGGVQRGFKVGGGTFGRRRSSLAPAHQALVT